LKILISAYACEPGKGSEPGIGWQWATHAADLGHDVWVVTRSNNRGSIEGALRDHGVSKLNFYYYDLPGWARWWKKGARGVQIYYLLWQWGAFRSLSREPDLPPFDWVHHLTFGAHRHPTFMGRLGIPLVVGPVGGGERTPARLRASFPLSGRARELLRDMANVACLWSPSVRRTYREAAVILCKTKETLAAVPKSARNKARVCLEVGTDAQEISPGRRSTRKQSSDQFDVLYVGRMVYWKGPHLALEALGRVLRNIPGAKLTMVGDGPERQWVQKRAAELGIDHAVRWIRSLKRDEVMQLYSRHDVFLFPSLHDSSGNVVLEAISKGLPTVVLDLGGPATIAGPECSRCVRTGGRSPTQVAAGLADELVGLARSPALMKRLSDAAIRRAREYEWQKVVQGLYGDLEARAHHRNSEGN
jgi:glycosyltransferase involved in cell wall biosynthesis